METLVSDLVLERGENLSDDDFDKVYGRFQELKNLHGFAEGSGSAVKVIADYRKSFQLGRKGPEPVSVDTFIELEEALKSIAGSEGKAMLCSSDSDVIKEWKADPEGLSRDVFRGVYIIEDATLDRRGSFESDAEEGGLEVGEVITIWVAAIIDRLSSTYGDKLAEVIKAFVHQGMAAEAIKNFSNVIVGKSERESPIGVSPIYSKDEAPTYEITRQEDGSIAAKTSFNYQLMSLEIVGKDQAPRALGRVTLTATIYLSEEGLQSCEFELSNVRIP